MASPRALWRNCHVWLDKYPLLRAFLWGVLAAAALAPLHLVPVLLFCVPALLRLLNDAPNWRRAALIGWLFGFGLGLAGLYWITEPILTEAAKFWWLVPFAAPALAAAVACYSIPPVLAARLIKPGFGQLLVFAGVWMLSNLAQQFWFSGFPWNFWGADWAIPGRLGDIFLQPAAIVGVHGLTLFTVILAGLPRFGRRGLTGFILLLALWAGFGLHRLSRHVPSTGLRIAMVQPDFPVPPNFSRPSLEANWQRLLAMSEAAKNAGANAIIWPEASSPWLLDSDAVARQQLAAVTGTTPVLAGSVRWVGPKDYRNALVVTDGPGPAVAYYDKWKLVPFGEYTPKWIPLAIIPHMLGTGFTPGTGPKTLTVPGLPPFGPMICYEDAFTGEVVDEAHRPDWLVTITDDSWFGRSAGTLQHFDDARLRAVEEGLPLARSANSGISAMVNPFGHIVASLPLGVKGVLLAPLPGHLPPTIFARLGLVLPAILGVVSIVTGWLIALLI